MSEQISDSQFEAWGIVDLFGHQRIAGQLSEQTIGGCAFLRVDVPAVGDIAAHTRLFGNGAIYSVSITTEGVARQLASMICSRPVQAYELPNQQPRMLHDRIDGPSDDSLFDDPLI